MLSLIIDFAGLRIENLALRILREMEVQTTQRTPAPVPAEPRTEIPRPLVPVPQLHVEERVPKTAEVAALAEVPTIQEAQPVHEPPAIQEVAQQPQLVEQAPEVETPVIHETAPLFMVQADEDVAQPPAAEVALEVQPITVESAVPVEPVAAEQAVPEPSRPPETGPAEIHAGPVEVAEEPGTRPQLVTADDTQRFAEEERLHSDAKRFARLLVSEIKLYNEQRVLEGRENRDIYVRLKRDIDRSREMYQKRVSPTVSRKVDYFHDELIRILGDNDPSHLGSDYPGPLVES
jgi:hypothetical protein